MAALIPSASATGSGTMTLAGPSTNSNQTITIPDATGTMMVSGNMPAFSVTLGSNQSITSNVNTKLQFNTEEFDTNNCFDSSTNYRFTPNVSGYYQITASVYPNSTTTFTQAGIYKNGSLYKRQFLNVSNNVCMVTAIVYFNGTTDYVECYGALTGVSPIVDSNSSLTYFQGSMVRGA